MTAEMLSWEKKIVKGLDNESIRMSNTSHILLHSFMYQTEL